MSRCEGCDCGEDCACESSTCDDCGYRLYECECETPEVIWSGAQWAVTSDGIQGLGARWSGYWIQTADLSDLSTDTEHRGLLHWPIHMALEGADLEDFLAAYKVALLHHDALISQSLSLSVTKARRIRFEARMVDQLLDSFRELEQFRGLAHIDHGLIAMCAHLAACSTGASAA